MIASPALFTPSAPCTSQVVPFQRASREASVAIAAEGISMVYCNGDQRFQALDSVDLKVKKGDIHLLMGPSGSGKTTLLTILAGLLRPTAGKICLMGQDITQMSDGKLAQFRLNSVGFIFQDCNLFPALTAVENIEVALKLKGIRGRKARKEAMDLLAAVGIADKANNKPRNLSGGQKQRVAIARALAGDPEIIVADEPTAALDSHSGQAVVELLRRLAKESGHTVLMVTHDPRTLHIADQISYLEDGILSKRDRADLQLVS